MLYVPHPHQDVGARWLALRSTAYLADEPRVGKTGTAIMAADMVNARRVLVITTKTAREVWRQAFPAWSLFPRKINHIRDQATRNEVMVLAWSMLRDPSVQARALSHKWDLLILDEAHYAISFDAERTRAVYGRLSWHGVLTGGIHSRADRVWALSGTPANTPKDLFPFLRARVPHLLRQVPAVDKPHLFLDRYVETAPRYVRNGMSTYKRILVPKGGRREAEFHARFGHLFLRRTQQDVGITRPVFETMPVSFADQRAAYVSALDALGINERKVLAAAEAGKTDTLEYELATLRRITGTLKRPLVSRFVREELDAGLDKLVLMAWHTDTVRMLAEDLRGYLPVVLDGSSTETQRTTALHLFKTDPRVRIFIGQIQACGEGIDLSVAHELIFVETSFSPSHMAQASMRITNHNQTRIPRVRVATLAGSIDDRMERILLRKWSSIRQFMK